MLQSHKFKLFLQTDTYSTVNTLTKPNLGLPAKKENPTNIATVTPIYILQKTKSPTIILVSLHQGLGKIELILMTNQSLENIM